jgi:hypothetical protein
MELILKLNVNQVNALISAIGEMPIKSGFGPLVDVIVQQVTPQLPQQEEQQEEQTEQQ